MSPPDHRREDRTELSVVLADADAEDFVRALLERGVERRGIRPIQYVLRRNPMRDAAVRKDPLAVLPNVHAIARAD